MRKGSAASTFGSVRRLVNYGVSASLNVRANATSIFSVFSSASCKPRKSNCTVFRPVPGTLNGVGVLRSRSQKPTLKKRPHLHRADGRSN